MKRRYWIGFLLMIAVLVLAGVEGRAQQTVGHSKAAPHERPQRLRQSSGPPHPFLMAPSFWIPVSNTRSG